MNKRRRPAVFLDRDGTILTERGYLVDPKRLKIYPSALKGLKRLQKERLRLVVLTNQSGISRGYLTLETLKKIHKRLMSLLARHGVQLTKIYFCGGGPASESIDRKPRPGMALRAARELKIDLASSYVIGDQMADVGLAHNIGAKMILVLTGGGRRVPPNVKRQVAKVSQNLETASKWIIADLSRGA